MGARNGGLWCRGEGIYGGLEGRGGAGFDSVVDHRPQGRAMHLNSSYYPDKHGGRSFFEQSARYTCTHYNLG